MKSIFELFIKQNIEFKFVLFLIDQTLVEKNVSVFFKFHESKQKEFSCKIF